MRALVLCILFVTILSARNLTPAWVELGPDGHNLARIIVESGDACPVLTADGRALPMQRREPVPEGFQPACEAAIPTNTKSLALAAQKLKLPATPTSVVIVGDTGCRIEGKRLQACNDPMAWPFLQNAQSVARAKPDLIVHVGDYLYREDACPDAAKGCAGPHGDNWPTWDADFFTPAAPALAAAPWAFSRGNHEACKRSWRGWYYYLDPRPWTGSCTEWSDAWVAQSGALRIGVMDSAPVGDADKADAAYVPQFAAQMKKLSGHVDWIAVHHPFWAYRPRDGALDRETASLAAAWDVAKPAGVQMVVSGHTHLFEFLDFGTAHPKQLVAGNGGTNLADSIKPTLDGETMFGAMVTSGDSRHDFGYTRLKRAGKGWTLDLMDLDGTKALACTLPAKGDAKCAKAK